MEDRGRVIDYTKPVKLPYDCNKVRKNFTQGYFDREIGRYKNSVPSEFQWAAEDKLINKSTFEEMKCQIPDSPRSTFLMVFSPDGKKVASTHGNHNVYVTDLTTGKNIQTLSGHPRTPWCIAFHPSSNQILASGCLGGQVRVWDLHGGSEVWTAESQTVIASLAFHPVDRMLVIATYNELHFWDWSQPEPFAKCCTKSEREKVRYVSFDRLGSKLITGIANLVNLPSQRDRVNVTNSQPPATTTITTTTNSTPPTTATTTQASSDQGRSITFCYRHLMNQYNQLVNRYFDLSRSRITPTIDRGTDPMDLLDLRTSGAYSESTQSNSSPSTSNSQSSSSSPLRFRITRSACRSYRPLSHRERYRIHSSVFSRLRGRSSLSPGSLAPSTSTATSATSTSQTSTTSSVSSTATISSSSSQGRSSGANVGPTSRSWCLTLGPENLFSTRTTTQSTVSSQAVTNPTYTSYSERGIFSTRESSSSGAQRSHFSIPNFRPYRLTFNGIEDNGDPPTRTPPPADEESSFVPATPEAGAEALRGLREMLRPIARSLFPHLDTSRSPNRDGTNSQSELPRFYVGRRDGRRDTARSSLDVFAPPPPPPPEEHTESSGTSESHGAEFSRNVGHSSTFYLTPMDLRNVSPVRRFREDANSDGGSTSSRRGENSTLSQSVMHPRPVPRFQVRSRLAQETQSQLHLITNRETHGLNLQNNQSLRRQLSFRPGGQFVLSRHSNSPFQPRVPHHIDSPTQGNSPTALKDTKKSPRPEIPSLRSSFTTSISSSASSSGAGPSSSSSGNAPGSVASNLSFSGESTSRQIFDQINRRLITDRVKMILRDRIRISSENAAADSTINYSRISGESEMDTRNMLDNSTESEENETRGLGPRGADPMLSSASEHLDTSNDTLLLSNSENSSSGTGIGNETPTNDGNRLSMSNSELFEPWETESEIMPLSLNSSLPINDVLNEQQPQETQSLANSSLETPAREATSNPEQNQTPSTSNNNNNTNNNSNNNNNNNNNSNNDSNNLTSPEMSMRHGIQLLSLHIENMQRLCWARIEILQLQKIRRMWEDLTKQIRHFHNTIQNRNRRDGPGTSAQNNSSNPIEDTPNNNDSAGGDEPTVTAPSTSSSSSPPPQPSTSSSSSNSEVFKSYRRLVESLTNELFISNRPENGSNNPSQPPKPSSSNDSNNPSEEPKPSTSSDDGRANNSLEGASTTDRVDEPQPGPSGVSTPSTSREGRDSLFRNDRSKFRVYKILLDTIQKSRKKKDAREGASGSSNDGQRQSNHFRLRHQSRPRFRSQRSYRNFLDSSSFRSRALKRELELILQTWKNERISSQSSEPTPSTSTSGEPSQPSTSKASTSSDACSSCGQKKKPTKDLGGQKRRNSDSSSGGAGSSSTASKVLKNNVGERSEAPAREENPDETNDLSSDHGEASTSGTQENSTNELLKQMIKTMKTMLRFQREAFQRTEELTRTRHARQESLPLPSSVDDDDDDDSNEGNDSNEPSEVSTRSTHRIFRSQRYTERLIENLMRDVTPLRAKRLLGYMIGYMLKSLTQFFGENFDNLNNVLGEQIFSLYMLLHLALELTDLLLDQLSARSRDLERTWAVEPGSEGRDRNYLLSRPSTSSGSFRERSRSTGRSFHNSSYAAGREEHIRSRLSHILRSHSRIMPTRSSSSTSCNAPHAGRLGAAPPNYPRKRRICARMSTSLPFGWYNRYNRPSSQSNNPGPSSSSTGRVGNVGNPISNRCRSFRFDTRNSGEGQSYSGTRTFETEINNNNNHNSNNNSSTSTSNNINGNSNDTNNNLTMSNDRNNDINRNIVNNSNRNSDSDSNNNNNNNNNNSNPNSGSSSSASGFSNNNNINNSNVSSFLNYYFPNGGSSNSSESSSNNIIIVTGLNSSSDLLHSSNNSSYMSGFSEPNSSTNNSGNSSTNSSANNPRQGGSNTYSNHTSPLPPLRPMELTLSRNENGDLGYRDERPIFWIRYGGNNDASGSSNSSESQSRLSTFTVPVVQVNDVPVSDVSMLNQPRHRPQSPVWRVPEDIWRWRAWRPRFLHPRYSGPNPFDEQDSNEVTENIHYYRVLSTSAGVYALDPVMITDAPLSPHHRIQAWDFSQMNIPDISDRDANGVVPECKIQNDASVDVSNDGHLLVTLLPSGRHSITTMLGVYSLDWSSLGQLLYRTSFEQNAVSVSLSPTNRHLLVGLASRPIVVRDRMNMAQIFRLEGGRPSPNGESWHTKRGRLVHMRDLEQTRETNIMSLNCIRWAPGAGQGLVYGTNSGQLKVLR